MATAAAAIDLGAMVTEAEWTTTSRTLAGGRRQRLYYIDHLRVLYMRRAWNGDRTINLIGG